MKHFNSRGFISDLKHYKYLPISKSLYEEIEKVDEYIQNCSNKVYILDSDAVLYTVPLNMYTKNYDMFNIGNFGSGGQEKIIEELKKIRNATILIKKDKYELNWQTPIKVIEYVKNNMTKVDEIECYDVYEVI